MRYESESNHDLVAGVFPRFRLIGRFYSTLSSHWLLKVFPFLLIGHCDYFGFGFTTLSRNALYSKECSPY